MMGTNVKVLTEQRLIVGLPLRVELRKNERIVMEVDETFFYYG